MRNLSDIDPRLKDWPMMNSPMPTLILTACYLYFVKIAGPRWMQHKKPFDLRNVMIAYNFTLVALLTWMFWEVRVIYNAFILLDIKLICIAQMGHLGQWGFYRYV